MLLSASVTPKVIASHLEQRSQAPSLQRAGGSNPSRTRLGVFSAASYGRNGKPDSSALDAAVESSKDAIRGLRTSARWPMRTAGAVMRSITIGG